MKYSAIGLLISLMAFFSSCEEFRIVIKENGTYALNASVEVENTETRAGFDVTDVQPFGKADFFWSPGDAIAVRGQHGDIAEFISTNKEKAPKATFVGYVNPKDYAVYPSSQVEGIDGDMLKYVYDDVYTYKSVDTDFFNGMSVHMPMFARIQDADNSDNIFYHLGGILAFKIEDLRPGKNQKFTIESNKQISGLFYTDLTESIPVFKTSEYCNEFNRKVTINFSLDETQTTGVFYVPMPQGEYKFTVTVDNPEAVDEEPYTKNFIQVRVERAQIRTTSFKAYELNGGGEGGDAEGNENGEVTFGEDGNATINTVTPEKSTFTLTGNEENKSTPYTLTFSSIQEDVKNIEINGEESQIEKLNINLPEESEINLIINLPNTSVTLLTNGNEVTLNEVTASTAENTLIVGNYLKIKKLIVNKGNVRINTDATVEKIERGSGNDNKVIVYYEGDKPEIYVDEDENFIEFVSVYDAFMEGMKQSGTVTLTGDLMFNNISTIKIPAGLDITLDLRGYTITNTSNHSTSNFDLFDVRGKLTVKNGTITTKHLYNMGWNASTNIFNVTAGGVLNIENATCRNLGGSDMAFVAHLNNWGKVTLNVDNSELESTYVAVRVFNSGNDDNNVTIQNTKLKANNCIWIHNYTMADFGNDENKVNSHKELLNFNDIFNANNTFEYNKSAVRCGFTNSIFYDAEGAELIF